MKLIRTLLIAFLAFVSCGSGSVRENVPLPTEAPVADENTTPVIIVTVDGVRWQDVFGLHARGLLPNLYHAIDTGGAAIGSPGYGTISASGPNYVSLPGYTEIFEGRTNTGCDDNFCNGATIPTLADEIRAQHADPSSVAIISSWERIAFAATVEQSFVVSSGSVGATYASELGDAGTHAAYVAGLSAHAWPGHADYRPDRFTAALALSYLKAQQPAFMFVGLGDTDEYGHHNDRTSYLKALHEADTFVGSLLDELHQMGERGRRTLVLVTADHGRADNFTDHGGDHPESARTWLFALGGPILARGFVNSGTHHLADIAPTVRAIVGLPSNPLSNGKVLTELLSPGS